jgi:ribonuclease III
VSNNSKYPLETPAELAKRLGLPFLDNFLLSRALTHRSYLNEHPEALEDNERLEFLGDAVLDFLVAAWVYHRFPEMAEGDLTRTRSALVHTERLAIFARKINLQNAMRLGRGEAQSSGQERATLLCDTFEALIGALFLEKDLDAVKAFLEPFLDEAIDEVVINLEVADTKSMLQEWAQAQGYEAPRYRTKTTTGPEHRKYFLVDVLIDGNVFGTGEGYSKQSAEKNAAANALKQLGLRS